MAKSALVVGLGQFGVALARSLTRHGVEVLAVDRRADRVQGAIQYLADARAMDAMDEVALTRLGPGRYDLCVVAIGDENREASILVTAMLRAMGAAKVIARATDPLHERVLSQVGAHEVVNPERAFGERLASRLAHDGVLDAVQLGDDLILTELQVPAALHGRTLRELDLPRRHHLTVVAIRRVDGGRGRLTLPQAATPLEPGDLMVVVGPPGAADALVDQH